MRPFQDAPFAKNEASGMPIALNAQATNIKRVTVIEIRKPTQ